LEKSFNKLGKSLTVLDDALKGLKAGIEELVKMRDELYVSAVRRFKDEYRCKHVDEDGYCTYWYWYEKKEGLLMREDVVKGKKVYRINVLKHIYMCALCPTYKPRVV